MISLSIQSLCCYLPCLQPFVMHMHTCRNQVRWTHAQEICVLQEESTWGKPSFLVHMTFKKSAYRKKWVHVNTPDTVWTAVLQLEIEEVKDLLAHVDTIFETSRFLPLSQEHNNALTSTNLTIWRTRHRAWWERSGVNKMVACKWFPSALKCTLYS